MASMILAPLRVKTYKSLKQAKFSSNLAIFLSTKLIRLESNLANSFSISVFAIYWIVSSVISSSDI